ncbi:MAG: hypothetical protein J6Q75_08020 [Bacteroidaceae bacterium]|nr:hypothetical protein [Bacteroidaceae bacterium]
MAAKPLWINTIILSFAALSTTIACYEIRGFCFNVMNSMSFNMFPFMKTFIDHLTERNYSNRTVAFMENGSWAPVAAKWMKSMLEKSKNITYTENNVTILSALNDDSMAMLDKLAEEL